ncbi:alpha/beta hydrolase [Streptomyces aidingensis]|uniref:Acetyl esterase n=1 Tax=Streptomyces aidingensis TaxID=910347 RepID=A0A1I1QX29_9ACTN|nr:alpha/beta hydrolase [Streptomyces aidingensis]SFD26646.1 acetyl esterase [Streptomyces aidingensis]
MPIESGVQRWLERSMPALDGITGKTPQERRAGIEIAYNTLMADYPIAPGARLDLVGERTESLPTAHGPVPLRVLTPPAPGPHPVFLHLFGGAWWQRTFDAPDIVDLCRQLVLEANVVVVQIDYALAPEHPYPTALHQAYAAVDHIAGGGIGEADPSRIAVGGISAGGNLAAGLALLARDRGGPGIALQVLEVPVLDLTLERYDEGAYKAFPSVEGVPSPSSGPLRQAIQWYLPDSVDATSPYASPLRAEDLADLPEALILTAEFDPLWAQGAAYADALTASGTAATAVRYAGQIHSAPSLSAVSASSRRWRAQVIDALRSLREDQAVSSHPAAPGSPP